MRRVVLSIMSAVGVVAVLAAFPGATGASADDLEELKEQRQQAAEDASADDFGTLSGHSAVTPWSGSGDELEELAQSLFEDDSIAVRNVGFTGAAPALGSYEGLPTGSETTEDGVILSTGLAVHADTVSFASTSLGQPGDTRLSQLSGGQTFDAAILEFEFQVQEPGIRFEFQFASEEWPVFVGLGFNDVFALDINGSNCALTAGGQPISVDDSAFSSSPAGLSYNGITAVSTCNRLVQSAPGWNTARFAIADTGDAIYDSAVLIAAFRRDIPPLMFVHGWTSSAAAWNPAVGLLSEVADLDAASDDRIEVIGTTPLNTMDAWASIEDNAQVIINQAQALYDEHDQRVNVIAHSKGGLDTRLASALRPDLFDTVVMLGTPNAGSIGADDLCALPVSLVTDKKRFGPCWRSANAGLNDLRTGSMLAFNRTWASPAGVSYYTLGGNKNTLTGQQRCWAENNSVTDQANSLWGWLTGNQQWWAYGTASPNGWDSPVCLNSLFSLSQQEWALQMGEVQQGPANFYAHTPLGYYSGYDHSDVQKQACALLPAFGLVLPEGTIEESTQIGQLDRACPALLRSYGGALVDTSSDGFGTMDAEPAEETDLHSITLLDPLAPSTELTLPSAPDLPVAVIVGHDADEVRLLADDGTQLEADISDLGPYEVAAFAADLPAGSTVTLEADGGTEAVVQFTVAQASDAPELAVEVTGTDAVATVTAPDGGPVSGSLYAITADDLLLVDGEPFSGTGSATIDLTLPIGEVVDVYAEVEQPWVRQLHATVAAWDEGAAAGQVTAQEVDGGRLLVTLPVDATIDARYGAGMALTDVDGQVVATGTAIGEVAGGSGEFAFTFELNAVQAAALQNVGALSFTDLTLTNIGSGIAVVAQLDGPFGTLDESVVGVPATPLLGSVDVAVDDTSIVYSIPVLATDGYDNPLLVQGQVLDPSGNPVKAFSIEVGDDPVEVALGSDELAAGGPGTYLLTQLRLVDGLTGATLHSVGSVPATFEGDLGDDPPPGDDDPPPGDDDPPAVDGVQVSPDVVSVGEAATVTAVIDHADLGGSTIESAEYQVRDVEGTVIGQGAMDAIDGGFGNPVVTVEATVGPFDQAALLDVCVRGTDDEGNTSAFECTALVVIDPDGGFVTGGGWFDSPEGAFAGDPGYDGRAHATVAARYHPTQNKMVGNAQFRLQGDGTRFTSTEYNWVIVSDQGTAIVDGTGELDGESGYAFRMWLRDGADGDADSARVRLTDPDGTVLYDNELDGVYGSDLGGGSITVH